LGGRYLSHVTDPDPNVVHIALEVPPQILRDSPGWVIDCAQLREDQRFELSHLLSHDLIENTNVYQGSLQAGQYNFDHAAVQVLWKVLHEGLRAVGSLPWGQVLERLESPCSEFRQHADTVLATTTSMAHPTYRTHQVGPSLEDIRFAVGRE
jgi:hypothetical protein